MSLAQKLSALQIENNTFTIESDINSILVINSLPKSENSLDVPVQRNSNSMNENDTYLKQLENEINKTKEKLSEVIQEKETEINKISRQLDEAKQENFLLTKYNSDLARRLEVSTNPNKDDDSDSIIEFVDVQNIAKTVEHYLTETNEIFKTEKDYSESMKYLIKNIWSLIAHDYSDTNLDQLKIIRDELIKKIDKVNMEQLQTSTDSVSSQVTTMDLAENVDFISNNELLESLTMEAFSEKLAKQNEIIKMLIQQVKDSKKNQIKEQEDKATNTTVAAAVTLSNNSYELTSNEDNEFISPGSSPSYFMINRFQKYLTKQQPSEETKEDPKEIVPPQITQTLEQVVEPTTTKAVVANNVAPANNEFFLHYSNGFINVQAGSMDHTLLNEDDNNDDQSTPPLPSPSLPPPQPEIRAQISQNEASSNIFACPFCNSSFNSTLFETDEVFMDKFQRHIDICNTNSKETCMFCLELFDKSEHVDFNDHVAIHLMELN